MKSSYFSHFYNYLFVTIFTIIASIAYASTTLNTQHRAFLAVLQIYKIHMTTIPILQMRKLRLKGVIDLLEVKHLTNGGTRILAPQDLVQESKCLPTVPSYPPSFNQASTPLHRVHFSVVKRLLRLKMHIHFSAFLFLQCTHFDCVTVGLTFHELASIESQFQHV